MSKKSIFGLLANEADRSDREFYQNGFAAIKNNNKKINCYFFQEINKLNQNIDNFECKEKNVGSLTLYNEIYNQKHELFVDYLFDTGLLEKIFQIAARPLYLTNYMHIITPELRPELEWHRDTHLYTGSVVGNIPPVIKLIIYSSDVSSKNSGEFEILGGTHRLDLHSQRFDTLLTFLKFKKHSFFGKIGDCLLFDTSCIHRRSPTASHIIRSATIYGFVTAKWQQQKYLKNHTPIIDYYQEKLDSLC
jgi:hypothetical protein